MTDRGFYTLKGYEKNEKDRLSPAMEDYLEMIFRNAQEGRSMGVSELAASLHVTPPSASKMARRLTDGGLLNREPYGLLTLTEQGRARGEALIRRHGILHRFFCLLNETDDELEQVEKIEHFISARTVASMEALIPELEQRLREKKKKLKKDRE